MKPNRFSFPLTSVVALFLVPLAATAADFYVTSAQDLQNALTTAAANGANNNIWLTNGYYTGNFNYNCSANTTLTVQPDPGLTNTDITLDGANGGRALNITCSGSSGNVTVSGITFMRNCGNYQIGALRIGGSSGGTTIVDGCRFLSLTNSSGMGIEIASGLNTSIVNCIITGKGNGNYNYPQDGNGFNISGVTGNTLINNDTVSENLDGYGAEIAASAVLTVSNSVFQNNTYGLYFSPSSGSQIAQLVIGGNEFNENAYGGANLYNFNSLNFTGNECNGNASGGVEVGSGSTAMISGNTFNGNYGYFNGGLSVQGVNSANVVQNTFSGNYVGYPGEYSYSRGAGAALSVGTATVAGNTFSGNTAAYGDPGGAVDMSSGNFVVTNNIFNGNQANGPGGAINLENYNAATVAGNTFAGNSCSGNNNGGALSVNNGTPSITGNTFSQNSSADGGGAISITTPGVITLTDNLIVNNSQSGAGASGGGVFISPGSYLYMNNNTLFGNSSGGSGGGASFQVNGLNQLLYVFNNIIWGNSATTGGSDVFLTGSGQQKQFLFNDADGMSGVWDIAQNNIDVSPQFFNPVAGDFHTQGTSPCVAAGSTNAPSLPLTDLDGSPRIVNGTADMGCYEFNTNIFHPADTNSAWTITAAEFSAYAAAWKSGQPFTNGPNPISANYLTRAGYLMTNGGAYVNDGSARPVNWKIAH